MLTTRLASRSGPAVLALAIVLTGGAACGPMRGPHTPPEAAPIPRDAAKRPDPAEERATMRLQLERSGPTTAEWTRSAEDVLRKWERGSGRKAGVRFSPVACYADGCLVTATYPDTNSFTAVDKTLPESAAFQSWRGPKYRSPPITREDGKLEADWIIFRPEEP